MKNVIIILCLGLTFVLGIFLTVNRKKIQVGSDKGNLAVIARSKPPGVVIDIFTAKSITRDGAPKILADSFAPEDDDLFLVVQLGKFQAGTRIEFVRYRNNKYVDHGSVQIKNVHANYASVNWSSHPPLGNRPKGMYLIKVYSNGKLEKTTAYKIS